MGSSEKRGLRPNTADGWSLQHRARGGRPPRKPPSPGLACTCGHPSTQLRHTRATVTRRRDSQGGHHPDAAPLGADIGAGLRHAVPRVACCSAEPGLLQRTFFLFLFRALPVNVPDLRLIGSRLSHVSISEPITMGLRLPSLDWLGAGHMTPFGAWLPCVGRLPERRTREAVTKTRGGVRMSAGLETRSPARFLG